MKIPTIRTLREYHRISRVGEITRRYFALNAFDGVLTILGILVGSYFTNVRSPGQVITLGFTASFAMGLSGFYGAYSTEHAERMRELAELEESTLSSLRDTELTRASTYAAIVVSLVDGLSPFLAAFIAIAPFLLGSSVAITSEFYFSFGLAFVELFALGGYLGVISRQQIVYSGVKMVTAGLLCVGVAYLLRGAVL